MASCVSARVVRVQPAATLSTGSQALQECGAFSHRASSLVGLGMHVGIDACLVGLEGGPIDIAGMMFANKHRPLGHGQKTSSLAKLSLVIDVAFSMRPPVDVRASIHRIGEDSMDGVVGRGDPTDLALHIRA